MKTLAVVLVVTLAIIAFFLFRQRVLIRQQQASIEDLKAQITQEKQKQDLFQYQERCAEQARKTFVDLGYKQRKMAAYQNHYNERLNKCFIEIMDSDASKPGVIFTTKTVSDVLEGKSYGEYFWRSDKVKKYWEVPPLMCRAVAQSGEERHCKSEDEFKEILKPYMEVD